MNALKKKKGFNLFAPLFFIIVAFALFCHFFGLHQTLFAYGHRQGQTAIVAAYFLKGGPWFAYELPTFGAPWAAPMEFPVYQWIIALIVHFTGAPLVLTGRIVSIVFFWIGAGILYFGLAGRIGFEKKDRWIPTALFIMAPIYLHWTRNFMIESTVLSFCLAYLLSVFQYIEKPTPPKLFLLCVLGTLSALIKVTTFLGFLAAAGLLVVYYVWKKKFKVQAIRLALKAGVAGFFVPALFAKAWLVFGDHYKELNPLTNNFLTASSENLKLVNYGTLAQRLSWNYWDLFLRGKINDVIGYWWLMPVFIISLCYIPKQRRNLFFTLVGLYFFVPLVLWKVHYMHTYYQYSCAIFLAVAVGVLLSELLKKPGALRTAGVFLLLFTFFLQGRGWAKFYRDKQEYRDPDFEALTTDIRNTLLPEEVLFIYGQDMSPAIPFYADRRALMDRDLLPLSSEKIEKALMLLRADGRKIGGLVNCLADREHNPADLQYRLKILGLKSQPRFSGSLCSFYSR